MLLFQDGSTHRWIAALGRDLDLILGSSPRTTLDDDGNVSLKNRRVRLGKVPRPWRQRHRDGRGREVAAATAT
jgi:hypothetical protein